MQTKTPIPLCRLPAVLAARGVCRSQLYDDIRRGLFPRPIKPTGSRMSAWPENEIAEINQARIAGKSNDEIKKLVLELEAARQKPTTGNRYD